MLDLQKFSNELLRRLGRALHNTGTGTRTVQVLIYKGRKNAGFMGQNADKVRSTHLGFC